MKQRCCPVCYFAHKRQCAPKKEKKKKKPSKNDAEELAEEERELLWGGHSSSPKSNRYMRSTCPLVSKKPFKMQYLFCPHQQKCARHDELFEFCKRCNLARGDGEEVQRVIDGVKKEQGSARDGFQVYFDFDQTLCSTKNGADPLKDKAVIDPDLREVAQELGGEVVNVLTRNSHAQGIEKTLELNQIAFNRVRSIRPFEKRSKHDVLLELLEEGAKSKGEGDDSVAAILVDDSHQELQFRDPGVVRVYFSRI
jgi:hypothetical protein